MSRLHVASAQGQVDSIRTLLATSAGRKGLRQKDGLGRTPLYLAVRCGHEAAAAQLLSAYGGGAAKAIYKSKLSLLHLAAHCSHTSVVRQLLEVLGQISDKDVAAAVSRNYGKPGEAIPDEENECVIGTPLHAAISSQAPEEIAQLLLAAPGGPDAIRLKGMLGWTPLHMAAWHGRGAIAAQLLQASPAPARIVNLQDDVGRTAVLLAAKQGHVMLVDQLLQVPKCNPAVVTHDGQWSALSHAAFEGHSGVVQRLLQTLHSDDVEAALCSFRHNQRGTPLLWAAYKGHSQVVEQLLSTPAGKASIGISSCQAPTQGQTPLHMAAHAGHATIVAQLLQATPAPGAIVNRRDDAGRTALLLAAKQGHLGVVQELLKVPECDAAMATPAGHWTALGCAACEGHTDVVERLLQALPSDDSEAGLHNGQRIKCGAPVFQPASIRHAQAAEELGAIWHR